MSLFQSFGTPAVRMSFFQSFSLIFLDPYVFQNCWLLHPTVILQRKLFFMVEKVGRKWMMGDLGSTNPTIGRYSILLPIKLYQLTLCLKPHHERNFRGGRILSQDFHHLFCLTNLQRRQREVQGCGFLIYANKPSSLLEPKYKKEGDEKIYEH